MAKSKALGAKVWLYFMLIATPAVVGYICLRSTVEFSGANDRTCTGAGRNKNCSTPEGEAQLQALFTGNVDQGHVSSDLLLWIARACFGLYGLLILWWLASAVVERVGRSMRRRRRNRNRTLP